MLQSNVPLEFYSFFEPLQILGRGSSGLVVKSLALPDKSLCAVKIIQKKKSCEDNRIRTQLQILSEMKHDCIVRLLDLKEGSNHLFLKLQLAVGGTLGQFIGERVKVNEQRVKLVIGRILQGLFQLHRKNIIHRDIKPGSLVQQLIDNILLMKELDLKSTKIADFSLSAILNSSIIRREHCGTLNYMAPEILLNRPYSFTADIYSVSVIMFLLMEGRHPFYIKKMSSVQYVSAITRTSPTFHCKWSQLALNFYKRISRTDPQYRYSAEQALKHPWLSPDSIKIPLCLQQRRQSQEILEKLKNSIISNLILIDMEESQPDISDSYQIKLQNFSKAHQNGKSGRDITAQHLKDLFSPYDILNSHKSRLKKPEIYRVNHSDPKIEELEQYYGDLFLRKTGLSQSPVKRNHVLTAPILQFSQTLQEIKHQEPQEIVLPVIQPCSTPKPTERKKIISLKKEVGGGIFQKTKMRGTSMFRGGKNKNLERVSIHRNKKIPSQIFRVGKH